MRYLLAMTDRTGKIHYVPKGYGFTVHALTMEPAEAETFETEANVQRWINNNIHCVNAFWNSERQHAELTRKKYAGWTFKAVPAME